ncbi:MAG: hypothetical protein Q8R01_13075 [Ramlibacter sp.]|nr:hypothetical protein [Ramlibacter sp.]
MKTSFVFAMPAAAAMLALVLWLALPASLVAALMAEAGAIETLTLFAYGAAIVAVCLTLLVVADRPPRAAILLLLLFLGAREMDLHMSLTGTSVLRFSYFLKGAFSAEKAGALAAVAVVLGCIGYLWWRHGALLWRGLRTGQPVAWSALAFGVTAVVAKTLDRSVSVLTHDFGLTVTRSVAVLVIAVEETLELSLPLLVIFAVVQYLRAMRPVLGATARQGLFRRNTAPATPPATGPASRRTRSPHRRGSAPAAGATRGS